MQEFPCTDIYDADYLKESHRSCYLGTALLAKARYP